MPEEKESTEITPDTTSSTSTPEAQSTTPEAQPWQAIFSPQHGAYYFYNTLTNETTWDNPLQPSPVPSTSTSSSSLPIPPAAADEEPPTTTPAQAHYAALQAAAIAQGIDPALAHLDPSLLAGAGPSAGAVTDGSGLPTFTAKFNARTGQFTRPDAREPGHLSEYDRARRMSEFYFDVAAWEGELARRGGALMAEEDAGQGGSGDAQGEGKKRKRPTKKDLERFKAQKKLKKIAKTAWLRT